MLHSMKGRSDLGKQDGLYPMGTAMSCAEGSTCPPVGTTRSWPDFCCAGIEDRWRYVALWLSEAGNSRRVAATALTAAGSSVQGRPALVQAWKLVTFEFLAASVSSTQASCRSPWRSGDNGSSWPAGPNGTGLTRVVVTAFRLKRLLRPISVSP